MMWVIQSKDGMYSDVTKDESYTRSFIECGEYEVTEVVPASDSREKDEMIQKLADAHYESRVRSIRMAFHDGMYAIATATDEMKELGLRKVGGTWERCK